MNFYSTNKKSPNVGLYEAIINGLAPDGGLYMPENIPKLEKDFFKKASTMSLQEVAFKMAEKFFTPDIPNKILKNIIDNAFNFELPIIEIDKNIYSLELFHGPTAAFKDFAARFMARIFGFYAEKESKKITILVATSGDTGGAVAHGFLNVKGIEVVILYPSGKVSDLQEKQLTGMGGNIKTFEVKGSFDDCQRMVKEAFMDKELRKKIKLASANSINIVRLLPQSFYHGYLSTKLAKENSNLILSIPSGNFGNMTAGIIAKKMGAPIKRFIASTNKNDIVPHYLKMGEYITKPSVSTISNAMDVGNPSNFARMLNLYKNDLEEMRKEISGASFSDKETKEAIRDVYKKYNYIMDPHGAIAYLGLTDFIKDKRNYTGVFFETAHPAKFSKEVEKIIKKTIPMPKQLKQYMKYQKISTKIEASFKSLKEILLNS